MYDLEEMFNIGSAEDPIDGQAAKHGYLILILGGELLSGPADDKVGKQTDVSQFLDALLSNFGLLLATGLDGGHVSQKNEAEVVGFQVDHLS